MAPGIGLLVVIRAFAIAFGVFALWAALDPPRRFHGCCETKGDIASATVKKYAYEAYPLWLEADARRACPAQLEELNEYMNNKDIIDPWGSPYEMWCDATEKRIFVRSLGEDARVGTSDDVTSF